MKINFCIYRANRVLVLFVCFIFCATAQAEDATQLLVHKLNNLKTMQANFSQVVVNEKSHVLQEQTGHFIWQRPGKFRWITQSPNEQWVVANGETVWIYDVDLAQVTKRKESLALNSTPALLLTGDTAEVVKKFKVILLQQNDGEIIFQLFPKLRKTTTYLHMILVFQGDLLSAIELADTLGQTTTIALENVHTNITPPKNAFTFELPNDVDIVND